MLNVNKDQSKNIFQINGVINDMDVKEGVSPKSNDQYISCEISVRVDQEIDGEMKENIIPIQLFSMRHKKSDGSLNKNYDRIKEYYEKYVSLEAVEPGKEHLASKVSIQAQLGENTFTGRDGREVRSWRLSTNFINDMKPSEKEEASFVVTGVVLSKTPEVDKEENETGRLIVQMCLIDFRGQANVVDFIAAGGPATHIDQNWEIGDTVKAGGIVSMTNKVVYVEEEMGFGESIKRPRTESRRELIITKGSQAGLDEDYSYDGDDIRKILAERRANLDAAKNITKKPATQSSQNPFDF